MTIGLKQFRQSMKVIGQIKVVMIVDRDYEFRRQLDRMRNKMNELCGLTSEQLGIKIDFSKPHK